MTWLYRATTPAPLGYRDRMRLPVPGPRDVVHLLERGSEAVALLVAAAPRVSALLDEAAALLAKADALMARMDETRAAANEALGQTTEVVTKVEELVSRSVPLMERLARLMDSTEPSLVALQPTLERLAETTDPSEVDALVTLIDHLPLLALKMETDIVPVLESLSSVSPDLRDLVDVSRELNEMLASVPGLGRIKKRIDEEQAERDRDVQADGESADDSPAT